jgi:hypothetical protein
LIVDAGILSMLTAPKVQGIQVLVQRVLDRGRDIGKIRASAFTLLSHEFDGLGLVADAD